jgi:hypothetical protein
MPQMIPERSESVRAAARMRRSSVAFCRNGMAGGAMEMKMRNRTAANAQPRTPPAMESSSDSVSV